MSNAEAIAAKEILNNRAGYIPGADDTYIEAAKVHAILAVADQLEQLIRMLRERP